jgi:hypothetical protein
LIAWNIYISVPRERLQNAEAKFDSGIVDLSLIIRIIATGGGENRGSSTSCSMKTEMGGVKKESY